MEKRKKKVDHQSIQWNELTDVFFVLKKADTFNGELVLIWIVSVLTKNANILTKWPKHMSVDLRLEKKSGQTYECWFVFREKK